MNRKTTVALVVFVVLGIAAYLVLREPPKGQRTGPRPRPIPGLASKAIKRVTIAEQGKPTVILERKGEAWALAKPVSYAADKYATRTLVEKLEKLEFGDLVTEQKASHAQHEVDERGGLRVTVADGSKTIADFYLGKVVADHTMFRPAGKDQVFQAVGSLRSVFSKEVKYWRDRTIVKFTSGDARQLHVSTTAGEIALVRTDDKAPWKVEKSSIAIDNLDESVPRSLLSSLSNLSAADFADGVTLDQAGLTKPQATLTVRLKDNAEQSLLVGKNEKDDYWVKSGSGSQVFLIKRYTAENLTKRPIDFRDKTIISFKADDLLEIGVTHVKEGKRTTAKLTRKGDAWHKDGKKLTDQTKAKGAAEALGSLAADRFAQHTAAELGLDRPEWRLDLRLKDRSRPVLTVGSKDHDGFFGVRRQGVPDLFACRKHKLDKFLLDPAELK